MKRKFSFRKFALFLIVLSITLVIIGSIIFAISYKINTDKVSNSDVAIAFTVEKGSTFLSLSSQLKEKKLIKSEFFYKLYIKLHSQESLNAGIFELKQNMNVEEIVNTLSDEKNIKQNTIKITFREGLNVRQIASVIEKNTDFKSEDVINKINDKTFLDTLINKYWFLTDSIKDDKIYYALEGYLYPNTYHFEKDKLSIENIITKMLDETDKHLTEYKTEIENSKYNVHQILTLSSLIELEAVTKEDRKGVSGVFYNRLNNGWSLGSDVTTYYSAKKDMTESLTQKELNSCNGYNTRCTSMVGLPVGPIVSPSISSIEAALNPTISNYYFFVADKNKKVYFTKDITEHNNIIAKLKKEGLWLS